MRTDRERPDREAWEQDDDGDDGIRIARQLYALDQISAWPMTSSDARKLGDELAEEMGIHNRREEE